MGFDLSGFDLSPGVAESLQAQYGPPRPVDYFPNGPAPNPPPAPPPVGAQLSQVGDPQTGGFSGTGPMTAPTPQFSGRPKPDYFPNGPVPNPEPAGPPVPPDEGGGEQSREPAPRPGVYMPAHWQPGTRSEAIRYGMDPEHLEPARSAYDSAQGHGIAAGDKRLEAAQQEGVADAVYASAHAAASQQAAAEMRRIELEKQAYIAQEHSKLNELSVAAQQKIDPDAARGGLGAQIMAAIGIGLGQFGASLNGGVNTAAQLVNANIDRRIRAQEMNVANAGKAADREQSLYRQNLDAFGDRERATLATKMQYLDQVKAMGDMQYAAAKHTMNEADKHAWDQKLMEQRGGLEKSFAELTENKRETQGNEKYIPGQVLGGSGGAKPLSNLVTLSDGTTVQMPNEKQQDKGIEKIQIIDKLQRYNNEALQARAKLAKLTNPLSTEYKTHMGTLRDLEESKAALLSSEAGQGVLRDSEYARSVARQGFYTEGYGVKNTLNPFSGQDAHVADANLRRQIQRGDEDQRAFVKAAGGHIVKRGYTHDAAGGVSPAARYTGQDVQPTEQLAPRGSVPMKKGVDIPTADRSLRDTTEQGEDLGMTPVAPASSAAKKSGGKSAHIGGRK